MPAGPYYLGGWRGGGHEGWVQGTTRRWGQRDHRWGGEKGPVRKAGGGGGVRGSAGSGWGAGKGRRLAGPTPIGAWLPTRPPTLDPPRSAPQWWDGSGLCP